MNAKKDDKSISNISKRCSGILKEEIKDVKNLLKKTKNIDFLYDELKVEGNKSFYKNIIFEIINTKYFYDSTKEFIMIGCGYLPLTLLTYYKIYPDSIFIGLDVDKKAIESCNKLRNKYILDNLYFKIADGKYYDYINSKTVLIAAMVKDKIKILNRILGTSGVKTKIFIRLFYDEDYEIVNKIKKSSVGLKVLFKINKSDYPKKEEYDFIIVEKSENINKKII